MNTPSPFVPQGTTPSKGKSFIYWFLMIVALHVAVFGGILLQGCKDTTSKETAPPTTQPDTSTVTSNTAPPEAAPVTASSLSNAATPNTLPVAPPTAALPPAYQPPPVQPPPQAAPAPTEGKEYVIAHGDTLGAIAKRNGISLKQLLEANPGVNPKKLKVGQKVQIPGSSGTTTATANSAGAPDAATAGDTTSYTVKSGDSLTKIAHAHHTTVKNIMALNDMKRSSIRAGQKIKLPGSGTAAADMAQPSPVPVSNPPAAPTGATATPTTN